MQSQSNMKEQNQLSSPTQNNQVLPTERQRWREKQIEGEKGDSPISILH